MSGPSRISPVPLTSGTKRPILGARPLVRASGGLMPIYEYECAKCGTFEAEQSIKDKPLSTCPKCKGKKLRKLISPPAFVFKGSGFYTTDYNRKGSSSPDSGGDSKTEKKSEKKPEKKPESPSASS